jgi:hypothetical protein
MSHFIWCGILDRVLPECNKQTQQEPCDHQLVTTDVVNVSTDIGEDTQDVGCQIYSTGYSLTVECEYFHSSEVSKIESCVRSYTVEIRRICLDLGQCKSRDRLGLRLRSKWPRLH